MSAPGLTLYRAVTALLGPLARFAIRRRARLGKEDPDRLGERFGAPGAARPEGRLVWLHAASVGESQVALGLAAAMGERRPDLSFLITSGTRTSAALIARRAPARTIHQFPPVDTPGWTSDFIADWKPNLGVFVESELWPNLIEAAARAGVPLALVNARMNEGSLESWSRFPRTARTLLSRFSHIGPADQRTAEGLAALTGRPIAPTGNLKLEAGLADPDPEALAEARAAVAGRPVFVAASTHSGEEAILAEAHRLIVKDRPDALMILAPRHPERAGEAAAALNNAGLAHAVRSDGALPAPETPVWLADTLGEMALWFALSPVSVICGTLIDGIGGHNPIEATRAGSAVITGPYAASFADVMAAYDRHGARRVAADAAGIARAVLDAWAGEGPTAEAGERALSDLSGGAMAATIEALEALLDRRAPR
ncbi:MAG: glycosyltransferase N-terminal domain-containing protein [Oceanicaulis sp.]